ncbi:MAG: acetyl-CoA hydrolase/transferase C-terminal domain-containing protein [Myxococcales bacterium]
MSPTRFQDCDSCIEAILEKLGKRIVLGTPLGIGKPNALLNALYQRAKRDASIELSIITALSLNPPRGKSELEERFYAPIRARVWGSYPRLDYLDDLEAQALPPNVRVHEFYLRAGAGLGNPVAQRDYISSNYTHVARDMMLRGVNLVMQAVAVRPGEHGPRYSLSSNPDVTLELLPLLQASSRKWLGVAQVNRGLPWLGNSAEFSGDLLHMLVDSPALDHPPFAVPQEPVDTAAWAVGLHASTLVQDGGTLQVGIGALGDAVCHALRLRERENSTYLDALSALGGRRARPELGGVGRFELGLYVASELVSNALFTLFEEGLVRRQVYEDLTLQERALHSPHELPAGGTAVQGAFFVGPNDFYQRLHALPEASRELIDMTSVAEVNRIYTDYRLEHAQRQHARFLNMTMMVTLLGSAVSDQLADGQVVSGVGGQQDFVSMAHQLPDGRSALLLKATGQRKGELHSNIVWQYPHSTIPRHMRDLFVTEYGVADLRGKSDSECVEALLSITDSRFQDELLAQAARHGKLSPDYRIPEAQRHNLPERITEALAPFQRGETLPLLPFGSDLTRAEWSLGGRLKKLDAATKTQRGRMELAKALWSPGVTTPEIDAALRHLGLGRPSGPKEHLLARLVRAAFSL